MLPNERQLITDLFERMRSYGAPQKDTEAEALIVQLARQNPDAGYMLVQSVLVQEQALAQAQEQINGLESRVRQLEAGSARAAPQAGGGSFLGGLFGGGRQAAAAAPPPRRVPAMGNNPAAARGPWGGAPAQPTQAAAGGGFMRSAMATAAGVAGGVLVANAISNMMNGGSAAQAAGSTGGSSEQAAADSTAQPDLGNNDPGTYEQTYDEADNTWADDAGGGGDFDL
jgi:hypothetical protein